MAYQLTPTTLIHLLVLLEGVVLAGYSFLRYRQDRHRSELLAYTLLMVAMGLWQLVSISRDVSTTVGPKLLGTAMVNAVAGPLVIYAFAWFVLAYSDNEQWVNRWTIAVACGHIALVSIAHILDPAVILNVEGLATRGPVSILSVTFSEWVVLERSRTTAYILLQLWAIAVSAVSLVFLGRYLLANRNTISPGQVTALVVGLAVGQVAYLLVFLGVVPLADNFTDISLGISAAAFAVGIFRYRILRVAPVGRKQVVEEMVDPVVMIDGDGRVVDANGAARLLVDAGRDWRGTAAGEFFASFPEHVDLFRDINAVETELDVEAEGGTRHFDLNIAPIAGQNGDELGYVAVFREVTTLKEREQELDLMRQIQSRVLRHNIRNDLQTVRLYGEHLEDTFDGESAEIASKLVEATDGLLSVSEKARVTEELIEGTQTPVQLDLAATLGDIVATYRESFPEVRFTLTTPEHCPVQTIPAMEFALENLVENAAEHNDGAAKHVDVTVTEDDGETVVTIADDGPGIPEQELDVVRSGEETPLQHGTGVGLWAIQWVVDSSTATIAYETSETGTVATVRFPEHAVGG